MNHRAFVSSTRLPALFAHLPLLTVPSTCRANAGCALTAACELGIEQPVCGGGERVYRNLDCAYCAYEKTWYYGTCKGPAADDDVVSTCSGTSDVAANYKANCAAQGRSVVCMQGQNYKNIYCAYCNDVPTNNAAFYGASPTIGDVRVVPFLSKPSLSTGPTIAWGARCGTVHGVVPHGIDRPCIQLLGCTNALQTTPPSSFPLAPA